MTSPAVTLCPISTYSCANPPWPCPVRDVKHEPHDWRSHRWDAMQIKDGWRHCNGVSLLGERAVG